MHYRNGREAKQGDQVVFMDPYGQARTGILYGLLSQSETCNGRIATANPNDSYVNIGDCVHADDVAAAFPKTDKPA